MDGRKLDEWMEVGWMGEWTDRNMDGLWDGQKYDGWVVCSSVDGDVPIRVCGKVAGWRG